MSKITVSAALVFSGPVLTLTGSAFPSLATFQYESIEAVKKAFVDTNIGHVIEVNTRDGESAPLRLELTAAADPNGASRKLYESLYVIRSVVLDGQQSFLLEPFANLEWTVDPAVAGLITQTARANRRFANTVAVTNDSRGLAKAGYGVRSCNNVGAAGPAMAIVYDPGVAVGWVRHIARESSATAHEGLHTQWR